MHAQETANESRAENPTEGEWESEAEAEADDVVDLRGSITTERLEHDLRQQILKGALRPGDPIKPVRELSKAYAISYNSVRRALNHLADEGLISLERGRGTFVRPAALDPDAAKEAPPFPLEQAGMEFRPHAVALEIPDARPEKGEFASAAPGMSAWKRWSGRRAFAALVSAEGIPGALGPSRVVEAVQRCVLENEDSLTLIPSSRAYGWPTPAQLVASGLNGALLFGAIPEEVLEAYAAAELPCVLVDRWPEKAELSAVVMDNFSGAYALTKAFVRVGHREICLIHRAGRAGKGRRVQRGTNAVEREAAARLALEEEGLVLRDSHVFLAEADQVDELASRLIASRPSPTGLLIEDLDLAHAVVEALRARGLSIPGSCSVTAFAALGDPNPERITAAWVDGAQMGESAINRLRQLMAGAPRGRMRIPIPVQVLRGRSIAPPRG